MPWNSQNPNFPLDKQHISDNAPALSGVVYIHNAGQHIYLTGVSNIRAALLRIIEGHVPCVLTKAPLQFSYQVTTSIAETIDTTLKLTNELRPICNPRN